MGEKEYEEVGEDSREVTKDKVMDRGKDKQ